MKTILTNDGELAEVLEASDLEETPEVQQLVQYSQTEATTMTNQNPTETRNAQPKSYPFRSKAEIVAQTKADPAFRAQCLLVLFNLQTAFEQATEETRDRNRQGFMSSHAVHGCRLAKKLLQGEELTEEDQARVETIVPRYGRQLAIHFRTQAISENPALKNAGAVFGV